MEIRYLLKALHIIGFVTWFAGLFGLVFLLILRKKGAGSSHETTTETNTLALLARKMYARLANPAMMVTLTVGLILIGLGIGSESVPNYLSSDIGTPGWMHAKLLFLVILLVCHLYAKRLMVKMEKSPAEVSIGQLHVLGTVFGWLLAAIVLLASFGVSGMLNYMYWGIWLIVSLPIIWLLVSRK